MLIPLVGILAALILAVVYAYADVYIPVAGYVSFILTALFAGGVGAAVSWAAVSAKCRNAAFVKLVALPVSLLALYSSWVAFEFVLARRDLPADQSLDPVKLFLTPSATWGLAKAINESGWYTIRGAAPKGAGLWVLWALEAVIIIGGVWLVSTSGISRRAFCERCARWCREAKGKMRLGVSREDAVYRKLSEGDWSAVAGLPNVPTTVSPYLRLDLQSCDTCGDMAVWQLHLVRHERTKEGKLEEKEHALTQRRVMTPQQIQDLAKLAARAPIEPPTGNEPESAAG